MSISTKQLARFNHVRHRITNGKAERFIQPQASARQWTLLEEWAYVIPSQTSAACPTSGMNDFVGKNT